MISVRFYIKKTPSIEAKIIARITKSRSERFEIRTDERIQPKFWDSKNQQVKSTFRGHYEINTALQEFKTKILKLYRDNQSFAKFKRLCQEKDEEKKTLFSALANFLNQYELEKDSKTLAKYRTLQKHLIAFDKIHSIDFSTLDFSFYDTFKRYLLAIPNPFYRNYSLHPDSDISGQYKLVPDDKGLPVGIFDDNVYSYIIQLKTFLAWSEKRGYQVNHAYKSWEVIRRVHDPISLTSKELELLENATFTSSALDVARDYLVFECRTGQRISDIKRFNLKDYEDGKWTFTPRKGNRLSNKTITVHFKGYCAPSLHILHKWNWRVPEISEQKLNDNIKRACKAAGIDTETVLYRWAGNKRIKISGPKYEFISSHTGRKSFITLALQQGLSVEIVMALTGITEYKTIRHYKSKFEDSAIEEQLERISGKVVLKKAL
jgi:hypothetical protein